MTLLQSQFTIKLAQLKLPHFHLIDSGGKIETCLQEQVTEYLEHSPIYFPRLAFWIAIGRNMVASQNDNHYSQHSVC